MTTHTAQPEVTPHDLLQMADGVRFELIAGRLRERAMGNHSSWVAARLITFLTNFADREGLGWVLGSDAGYTCFANPNTLRRPDVSFVRRPAGETSEGTSGGTSGGTSRPPEGWDAEAPDLVVEVFSPNDLAGDVEEKTDAWLRAGVRLVWVVNPEARSVRVQRPDGSARLLREDDALEGEAVLPGFHCPVARLFAPPGSPPAPAAATPT